LGPATLAVVRDLVDTGESRYLEELRASMPEGLVEMLDVPGLTPARVHRIYEDLKIHTVEDLEVAATDGRLAALSRFGPKTAAKILDGIAMVRRRGTKRLFHHAAVEAHRMLDAVRSHPSVERAELAGGLRRRMEVIDTIEIVAACRDPSNVSQTFARLPGVRASMSDDGSVIIEFVDGVRVSLRCVVADAFGVAWWRATGSVEHVAQLSERLAARGFTITADDALLAADGRTLAARDEDVVYHAADLPFIAPELREGLGEVDAAANGALPNLVEVADIKGVLHCHTHYSDGKASVGEMAAAAQARGWSYIGITDHSTTAVFAGGLTRDKIVAQHDMIDELNTRLTDFRILKGIEADILADGRVDDCDGMLDTFDFVVGSIHSRFSMTGAAMTERVLRALDDPRLTILGHPTGRLLLAREPYPIDLAAVLAKAGEVGVAVEINADPRRLDIDWRHLRAATAAGAAIEIGPDAHSTRALDNMEVGVGIARKGWIAAAEVLNARSADDVLAFARARRTHD
jgi:DNA polymerase (family 10)